MFIGLGYSHIFTTLSEVLLGILVTLVWYLSYKLGMSLEWQLYIEVGAAVIIIGGVSFALSYCTSHEQIKQRIYQKASRSHPKDTRWWYHLRQLLDYRAYDADRKFEENGYKKNKFN